MELSKKNLIRDLTNLISIPSFENENEISNYIIQELKKNNLNPKKDRFGNVILETGKGKGFLLNSHMDTVDIKGWEDRALKPRIKNKKIYGRGASDTKSGIATMMEIARKIKNENPKRKIIFLFSVKEEDSSLKENGAYLACKNIKANDGFVFEPTFRGKTLNIGVGCKGTYRCKISIFGKAVHSSRPEMGINSLYLANDFIDGVRKMKNKEKTYKILNKKIKISSVCLVTEIKAEEGINIIPQKCVLSVDYRTLPDEKKEEIKNRILKLCRKHFYNGFKIKDDFIKGYLDYNNKTLQKIKDVANKHGYKTIFYIGSARNDGTIFSNYGSIKSICFGTGEAGQQHTVDEYVSIKGFLETSEIIYSIIKDISK